jgi:transmembrane sensor
MTERNGWNDTDLARLRLEGLDHLNRLQSGEATDRDAAALIAWRAQSRAHEEAFRAALRLRSLVRRAEREGGARGAADLSGGEVVPFPVPASRRVSRRQILGGAIAASAAGAAFMLAAQLDLIPSPAMALADLRTGPGERRRVALANGASVELNTRTAIDLRDGVGMPAIALVEGELILSSGPASPAAMIAAAGTSFVHGGRFNARREGAQICITCLAGTTQLEVGGQRRTLLPTEQVRYEGTAIGAVERVADSAALTAWQSGTLIFNAMPLRQVVGELNRYRPGHVFLANDALAERPLSGTYYIDRLDDFFRQAELALGMHVARYPGNIVVLS